MRGSGEGWHDSLRSLDHPGRRACRRAQRELHHRGVDVALGILSALGRRVEQVRRRRARDRRVRHAANAEAGV
eukprot:5920640-Prymnesium_polylepis.1